MNAYAYRADVKFAIELIKQLLTQADDAATLVLVGDLSQFREFGLTGVTREDLPEIDEVYCESYGRLHIPLSGANKFCLKKEVLPLIGIRTHIREVEMQRYGRLLFSARDYFHSGAALSDWFRHEFVQELEQNGVIHVTHSAPPARTYMRRAAQANYAFA